MRLEATLIPSLTPVPLAGDDDVAMSTPPDDVLNRRDFLKLGGVAVTASATGLGRELRPADAQSPDGAFYAAPPLETVRIGMVGVGLQGSSHVENFLKIPGCRIIAVCDVRQERTDWASRGDHRRGPPGADRLHARPARFRAAVRDRGRRPRLHRHAVGMARAGVLAAMKNGKHAATEVPAAMTLDDCWELVEPAEKHQKHCVMMENCNYDRAGDDGLQHGPARASSARSCTPKAATSTICAASSSRTEAKASGAARGRSKLNGNLYPTHGLGPVANCLDINRGDRFEYLVSMSGPSRGLQAWAREHCPPDAPAARGEVTSSATSTSPSSRPRAGGRFSCSHDTNLPRPYSRIHLVQGTKGLFQGYPNRVYIEGRSKAHQWEDADLRLERVRPSRSGRTSTKSAAGRRSRRHGLHRGLPADQVPARGRCRPT